MRDKEFSKGVSILQKMLKKQRKRRWEQTPLVAEAHLNEIKQKASAICKSRSEKKLESCNGTSGERRTEDQHSESVGNERDS